MINRRRFLNDSFKFVMGLYLFNKSFKLANADEIAPIARFWISTENSNIKCLLCAQKCLISEGKRGKCKTRINTGGKLRSLVYGRPVSIHVDPIEKKPFYHFLPGSSAFSLSTTGCPLSCKFCQNWEISQAKPEDFTTQFVPPEDIATQTQKRNATVIAFTYNEPTVFAEYLLDIAKISRQKNLKNVLISCGFMNKEPLDEMCDVLDAIKIDLKGFDKDFYKKICGGDLEPVLSSIKQIAKRKVHLEIVNLVVPTLNDSQYMLSELIKWVAGEIGTDIPVHFTRFHPDYQMTNLPPTPVDTLERAYETAKKNGLNYPFVGNVAGHPGNNTYCPKCGKPVIIRTGFFVTETHLKDGNCSYCNKQIAGVFL
ncbi:MAG: AmmeMemoRadiSam system radical SAM enzyme [Desulfobacterales bacterium]|nr:AmmeMemoRadiSam system radical SAM enzyme [Desulfobacterales bacterium]